MICWRNGNLVHAASAIDAGDRGFTLGDGVFETVAVVDQTPLRLAQHLKRLAAGAAKLGIPIPANGKTIAGAIVAVFDSLGMGEGAARITLTRGVGARGINPPKIANPTIVVTGAPMAVGTSDPVRAIVATSIRRNELSPLSSIKSLNYLEPVLARREAADKGADDAIMLNIRGKVAEATAANIFVVVDHKVFTPPLEDGVLPGTMREIVMKKEAAIERSLTAAVFAEASEVFLTNALSLRPVVAVDGKPIGRGQPGEIAKSLASLPRLP